MKIAVVGEKQAVSPDMLRYYERVGLIPRVNRKDYRTLNVVCGL